MNTRHKNYMMFSLFLSVLLIMITSCDDDDEEEEELIGNWVELSDLDGTPRSDAVTFSIGGKGYLGLGYDGEDRLSDFWEYDPEKNAWAKKADFPGVARNGAVGFAVSEKGYMGTGYDGENKLNDFWQYSPESDTWKQVSDFAGSPRYGAVAFSIGDKAYVGTGYDGNHLKDFWEYDPANDTWTQKTSVGGGKRRDALAFVINSKGYICTGVDNGSYETDFWEYAPETDSWTKKRSIADVTDEDYDDDYTTLTGISKVGFAINGLGYMATGGLSTTGTAVWEYDPVTDLWQQKTALEGSARIDAAAFSLGDRAYITTGRSSSYYFDDIWAFEPNAEYDEYD